jgi:four helix bundle protein
VEKQSIRSFEDLECWKACTELRRFIGGLLKKFPPEEKYGLTDNMRRASRSITQNIAEGYGRFHYKENIQFCRQSRGSLFELADQFITARDEGYISNEEYESGRQQISKCLAITNGYINYLRSYLQKQELQGKEP